jgi:hypothetical protein
MNGPCRSLFARRLLVPLACTGLALFLPACTPEGNFTVLGYTTAPNYDTSIHTVRVPIFENRTYRRGLEFQLTEAVVREINAKTPYRVVGCDQPADTELRGRIIGGTKGILNLNQQAEIREAETAITVELSWVDLRTGEVLSRPGRRVGEPYGPEALATPPFVSGAASGVPGVATPPLITGPTAPIGPTLAAADVPPPPPGAPPPPPPVIRLRTVASYIPEVGESTTTGFQFAINKMAVQIVSMMEKPW